MKQELNLNYFGTYQQPLKNLLQLMREEPYEPEIMAIAQKIMEERLKYENRIATHKNKISKLKYSIFKLSSSSTTQPQP
jgi:hypothetical protein